MKKKKNIVRFILHTLVKKYKKFKDTKEKLCIYSLCSRNFHHFVSFLFPNFYNIALKLQTIVCEREKIYISSRLSQDSTHTFNFISTRKRKKKKLKQFFRCFFFCYFKGQFINFTYFNALELNFSTNSLIIVTKFRSL